MWQMRFVFFVSMLVRQPGEVLLTFGHLVGFIRHCRKQTVNHRSARNISSLKTFSGVIFFRDLLCLCDEILFHINVEQRISASLVEMALWSPTSHCHVAGILYDWGYLKTKKGGKLSCALGRRQICFGRICGWGKQKEPGWRRHMLPPATKLSCGNQRWQPWKCRSSTLLSN